MHIFQNNWGSTVVSFRSMKLVASFANGAGAGASYR